MHKYSFTLQVQHIAVLQHMSQVDQRLVTSHIPTPPFLPLMVNNSFFRWKPEQQAAQASLTWAKQAHFVVFGFIVVLFF
jgi:hypothetical protein